MMVNNRLIKALFYGGLDKEDYQRVQNSLIDKNSKMLFITGAVCILLFIGMFVSTFFPAQTELMDDLRLRSRLIYGMMVVVCGIVMVIRQQQHNRFDRFIIIEWYIFLSILFGFAIWAGTYNQPYNPSITFFVFLFALPLLIIERPIRLGLYLIIISIIFLFCSFQTKESDLYELDLLNCICFLYLSISLSMIMMVSKYKEALHKMKIEEQRDRDVLTGLLNKAAIEREVCRYLNLKETGCLMIVDIDDFKYINDHFGHLFGDAVLCAFARCFESLYKDSAVIGRFGGDEFIIFIKNKSGDEVGRLFEKSKRDVQTMINFPIHDDMHLSMSAGATVVRASDNDYRKLLEMADRALYEAKREGKNRIIININEKGA